jgi:hypothetical protein
MNAFTRRVFLTRSSMAVAAAGAVSAIPGLSSVLTAAESDAPASEALLTDEAAASMTEPLVAHVRDLSSGEIGLFSGEREVVFHDPGLAHRLFNATR